MKQNLKGAIKLDNVILRDYQIPIFDAIFNKKIQKVIAVLARRAGKDMTALVCAVYQLVIKVCKIYYIFPSLTAARKSAFDNIRIDGVKFLDYIPKEIIKSINSSEMKITLINGSILQFVGAQDPGKLRGVQVQAVIYSEFAFFDYPDVRNVLRPVLAGTPGSWELLISTPHAQNFFYDTYLAAKNSDEWFVYHKGLRELKHIPYDVAYQDVIEGLMSEEMFKSEYLCEFTSEVDGSIYSRYVSKMEAEARIGAISYDEAYPVNTSWDLGVRDATSILFFQIINRNIYIIDSYEANNVSYRHYAEVIKSKPYLYGKHIFPHDIRVRESTSAVTREDTMNNLGVEVTVSEFHLVKDGIESSRNLFSRLYIDKEKNIDFVRALKEYHYIWDRTRGVFNTKEPYHNWASHYCDSFRILAMNADDIGIDYSPEELDEMKNSAVRSSLGPKSYGRNFN